MRALARHPGTVSGKTLAGPIPKARRPYICLEISSATAGVQEQAVIPGNLPRRLTRKNPEPARMLSTILALSRMVGQQGYPARLST